MFMMLRILDFGGEVRGFYGYRFGTGMPGIRYMNVGNVGGIVMQEEGEGELNL